jgi:hypothetical protein
MGLIVGHHTNTFALRLIQLCKAGDGGGFTGSQESADHDESHAHGVAPNVLRFGQVSLYAPPA